MTLSRQALVGPTYALTARDLQAAVVAALCFFFVLGSYYLVRPIREQLGAAAGGSEVLPWLWTGTFLATIVLTPCYGAIVARYPRRVFIPIAYLFFAVGMVSFSTIAAADRPSVWSAAAFYIWVSVFNLFVVAVFWSFMADLFTEEQARRLFGPIGIGGTIGAIAGPTAAKALVAPIGVAGLLWLSSAALLLALICVLILTRWALRHGRRDAGFAERPIGGHWWSGAKAVVADPFMRSMAMLMLLADVVGTMLYALNSDIARDTLTTAVDRTAYFASIDQSANLLQIFLQLLVAPVLLVRFGPLAVMLLHCGLNATVLSVVGFSPGVETTMIATIVARASGFGLLQPAREGLYTRVSREFRYKAKAFIDTAIWRAGDVVTSFGMVGLRALGFGVPAFATLAVLASAASAWFSWRAVRHVDAHRCDQ